VVSLSLVIPATNDPVTLERVLAAVESADPAPDEVIVVREPESLGPAAARNRGAQQAAADVLVFLDADVEVHPDAFGRIRAAFEEDRELAALFGSYDDDPGADGVVSAFRNLLHHHVHHEGAGPATTFWAGLGAVRREVFHSLGGFDATRYPHASVEDIELGMRLHASGARIVLDPEIQGKHLKTWTLLTMTETDLLRRGVPWLRLVLESRSRSPALNLGPRHVVATGASVLLVIAVLRRDLRLALALVALLLVLDRHFYVLLARRQGPRVAAAGLALHVAHRLTSAAAVPLALSRHLREHLRSDDDA
jgi:cellulose synthase/poly-beta-1,6-N-acetylglucosamine synthase-like glycosyltransferase